MHEKNELAVFCKNVRFLREQNHLSKQEMAKVMGISTNALNQIENGFVPFNTSCDVLINIYHMIYAELK